MRRSRLARWLILILLVGVAGPSPRMAGFLVASLARTEAAPAGKPAQLRGSNRLDTPAVACCATARDHRAAPRRQPSTAAARRLAPADSPARLASPGSPAPVALRLRC